MAEKVNLEKVIEKETVKSSGDKGDAVNISSTTEEKEGSTKPDKTPLRNLFKPLTSLTS